MEGGQERRGEKKREGSREGEEREGGGSEGGREVRREGRNLTQRGWGMFTMRLRRPEKEVTAGKSEGDSYQPSLHIYPLDSLIVN